MKSTRCKILLLYLGFALCKAQGQNLVRNPGFDSIYNCPIGQDELYQSVFWYKPTLASSDLYSTCGLSSVSIPQTGLGYQNPQSDTCFAGILVYNGSFTYREYISTELSDTLNLGKKYCISFYLNHSNSGSIGIDNVGAFFSNDSININNGSALPYTPQFESPNGVFFIDTLNWTLVSGEFIANGDEKFITIGNFHDSTSTDTVVFQSGSGFAYYFIEDVSVYEKIEANAGNDSAICSGDSLTLGDSAQAGASYLWQPSIGLSSDTAAMPIAFPSVTTTYTLTLSYAGPNCTGNLSDTITITVKDDCIEPELFVPSGFSPNGDGQNDILFAHSNVPLENFEFAVYDRIGELVYKTNDINVGWDGNFHNKKMNSGVFCYYMKGTYNEKDYLIKGDVTLIR